MGYHGKDVRNGINGKIQLRLDENVAGLWDGAIQGIFRNAKKIYRNLGKHVEKIISYIFIDNIFIYAQKRVT